MRNGIIWKFKYCYGFSNERKATFLILLAEGLALLAVERDLLAESGWVLALDGGSLAKRDYSEI